MKRISSIWFHFANDNKSSPDPEHKKHFSWEDVEDDDDDATAAAANDDDDNGDDDQRCKSVWILRIYPC